MKRRNRIKVALRRGFARTFAVAPVVFLLVAGAGCPSLFESSTHRATHIRQAVPGSDGPFTAPNALDTVVNVYAQLAGTVDPKLGDMAITVNDVNGNFTVAKGDLLLIVQMAGATIDTTDSETYGTVTANNLGSAGRYEFVGVEGKSGNDIALACGLKNGYSLSGKTQVIRVPQYTTLSIGAGNAITAPAWDGVTGGVVAVHAENTLQLGGSIDVSAKGFRGGAAPAAKTSAAAGTDILVYRSTAETDGAEKGEGIAGYPPDFVTGQYGRGAPANGGGGGDSHNAGGGGGANAGDPAGWIRGLGIMLVTANVVGGAAAWPIEVGTLGTLSNSEGGGRGGYSYSANGGLDPRTAAGGPGMTAWGGDDRREVGGRGGHPAPNDPTARLFMGGGGGAGDGNNGVAGRGGRGGGMVFVITGPVTGAGSIVADGEAGADMPVATTNGDAPGGGGGGGTVFVHATSLANTITISADGGKGGDHLGSSGPDEVEGPGGGGGGGYIAVSGTGTPTLSATGALGGTTNRTAMVQFPSDGATAGHAGLTNGSASTFLFCGGVFTTIETHPASHSKLTTGDFTFTNTANPVTYECKLDTPAGTGTWADCNTSDPSTPAYTTGTLTDGTYTLSVRGTDAYTNVENPPATYTWNVDTVPPVTTIETHPTDPSNSPTGTFTFTNTESPVTYECKLDSADWAACNAGAPSSASYTTGVLPDGSHTLSVRSTDQAGNVELVPPSFTWTIQAGALDGGTLDAEGALDSGAEVSPVAEDAEGMDALSTDDVAAPDLAADQVLVVGDDTAPVIGIDAAVDAQNQDLLPVLFDAGASEARDTKVLVVDSLGPEVDALADAQPDAQSPGAEPNPDTAGPVANDDAASVPINKDAAVTPAADNLKILGSGFCAIALPRSTSPMPFMVMALAALALLGRRRKR